MWEEKPQQHQQLELGKFISRKQSKLSANHFLFKFV
nr:unnamed protein product [Callosobruchus chinensis]